MAPRGRTGPGGASESRRRSPSNAPSRQRNQDPRADSRAGRPLPNPALSRFHYNGPRLAMAMVAREGSHFWSNGYSWGVCEQRRDGNVYHVKLSVLGGALRLQHFNLLGAGRVTWKTPRHLASGDVVRMKVNATRKGTR